jgi:hypothetical protein
VVLWSSTHSRRPESISGIDAGRYVTSFRRTAPGGSGVEVAVGVEVGPGPRVGVRVGEEVRVGDPVRVGVGVALAVAVEVGLGVGLGEAVGVGVVTGVGVSVGGGDSSMRVRSSKKTVAGLVPTGLRRPAARAERAVLGARAEAVSSGR